MPKRAASAQSDNSEGRPEPVQPKLLRAVEANDVLRVKTVIDEVHGNRQCSEAFLSIGLFRACDKNFVDIARYLLTRGADPNYVSGNKPPSLLRAAEYGLVEIAKALTDHNVDLECGDKKGRTALMTAAWKGHLNIVQLLVQRGANIDTVDLRKRNVLHNVAADRGDERSSGKKAEKAGRRCGIDIVHYLLQAGVNIDAQDELGRTALHWACVTDNEELMSVLLTTRFGGASPKSRTNAVDFRMKTALHFAASHNRGHLVELLLRHGADVHARSDGGWTPLHNACQEGSVDLIKRLVDANADVNGELLNGRTPLHIAAEFGNEDATRYLLSQPHTKRTVKDRFGSTPLLMAAQHGKKRIAEMLAPWNRVEDLSRDEIEASKQFNATIVDFGNFRNENRVTRESVHKLLYARDPRDPTKHAISTMPKNVKATNFRWIHLPVNNIAWCEALLTKRFIEEGATDIEGYKALETSFNHQHRGQMHHSRFMRPMCQVIHRTSAEPEEKTLSEQSGHPAIIVEEPTALPGSRGTPTNATENGTTKKHRNMRNKDAQTVAGAEQNGENTQPNEIGQEQASSDAVVAEPAKSAKPARKPATPTKRQDTTASMTLSESSITSKGSKKPKSAASKSQKKDGPRPHPRNSIDKAASSPSKRGLHGSCNIFLFMPYLHFETDSGRRAMQYAMEDPERLQYRVRADADEVLIRAHLTKSSSFLHVRRTLDQFFYHNIDTHTRDCDQVVYRFQKKHRGDENVDPKVFMVDQLWMWVLGKDLVVTSFPQRWRQPRNDPLNVLEGIIEDINSKTRDPVQNVYELAMTISGRCFGTFDRHRKGDTDFQFLDMFESSIGAAMDGEASLFQDFSQASRQASEWLQSHQKLESRARQPQFFDKLLDVGAETDLLAEIKDIRDELDIIRMVLDHQDNLLPDLRGAIRTIYLDERSHPQLRKVEKGFEEQEKTISNPIKDIKRMDNQAHRIYESIRDLLDLKQKHANAFEARYAREQATGTQRQGRTIMVFTIVTVIFLPLSFVAAFFAINVKEFPHPSGDANPAVMDLSYVSAWIFGIGLAISIPCIAVALSVDEINVFIDACKRAFREMKEARRMKRMGRTAGEEGELTVFEKSVSVSRSMRRSGEVNWNEGMRARSRPPRRSADPGWDGAYNRRRTDWDIERGGRRASDD
ncbi:unnamed protein product [Zymoseptoria tritici ST99CH_1E4]|uniref:Uncharacterized protein n=1 Tax=Zymoseptoria tritici ST99CH_1E4 TaxID=1276532 RepID=A0A2H1GFJ8_ZYMTR|nr:unnamed protein product [Zymoseptoria tritici ST99CH_1E4]